MISMAVKSTWRIAAALLILCFLILFYTQSNALWRPVDMKSESPSELTTSVPIDTPVDTPMTTPDGQGVGESPSQEQEFNGESGSDDDIAAGELEEATSPNAFPQPTMTVKVEEPAATGSAIDGVIVMGKQKDDDTDWVAKELPEWQNAIYVVNDHTAPLHTLANKGREAQPYLTYIVDNYHNLPETIVFLHPHKDGYPAAWHTDAPGHSNVASIKSLNIDFIQRNGYANLRCIFAPGCPDEVQPFREPRDETRTIETNMPAAWFDLFNTTEVPPVIATPCCAQFAVSRTQVLKRPWEDYKKYHTWLLETSLDDDISGRIFEYLWHIIFGQDPVYCPDKDQCWFDVYGRE